jgi:hypothetical protein
MEYIAMLKQLTPGAALAAAILTLAVAQHATAQTTAQTPSFVQQQSSNQWRSTKLVGSKVRGPDNQNIGEIEDLIVDQNSNIQAVVIGVGGFLGIGEKHVAIPFKNLTITSSNDGKSINHVSVSYTRDQLQNAPTFKYLTSNP